MTLIAYGRTTTPLGLANLLLLFPQGYASRRCAPTRSTLGLVTTTPSGLRSSPLDETGALNAGPTRQTRANPNGGACKPAQGGAFRSEARNAQPWDSKKTNAQTPKGWPYACDAGSLTAVRPPRWGWLISCSLSQGYASRRCAPTRSTLGLVTTTPSGLRSSPLDETGALNAGPARQTRANPNGVRVNQPRVERSEPKPRNARPWGPAATIPNPEGVAVIM